jgi:hypothetical protein
MIKSISIISILLVIIVNCATTSKNPQEDTRLLINLDISEEVEREETVIPKNSEKLSSNITNEDTVSVRIVLKNLILKPSFWNEVEYSFLGDAELRLFGELTEKGQKRKNVTFLNDKDIDSFDISRSVYGNSNTIQLSNERETKNNVVNSKYTFVPVNRVIFSSAKVSTSAPSLHMRLYVKEIDQILQGTDRTRLEQVFNDAQTQNDILVDKSVLTKATGKKWHDYLALIYGVFEIFGELYNVINYDDDVLIHNFILQKDSWYSPRFDTYLSVFKTEDVKKLRGLLKEKHEFRNENGIWTPLVPVGREYYIPEGSNVMAVDHLISIESPTCFAQIEIEVAKDEWTTKDEKEKGTPKVKPPTNPEKRNLTLNLDHTTFAQDKFHLNDIGKSHLDAYLIFLKQNPTYNVAIIGQVSPEGLKEHNLILAENRAKAVKEYLENKKLPNVIDPIIACGTKFTDAMCWKEKKPVECCRRVTLIIYNSDDMKQKDAIESAYIDKHGNCKCEIVTEGKSK